jgi:uncharacterized protein YigA (DUF484 family)
MSSRRPEPGATKGGAGGGADTAGGGTEPARAKGSRKGRAAARPDPVPEVGLEAKVADYLDAHPDFFERNPEVLGKLQVPHVIGGAVSLIEHQVTVLRRQLETERSRLSHLISRARDYESLSNRLHALVLRLIPARHLEGLREALTEALCQELKADAVSLKLFPIAPGTPGGDPLTESFQGFLDREQALCGPLDEDKTLALFGEAGASVRSAALIPIRAEGCCGVLAIGATDPGRFVPDMGTDLLDRLGEIVGCKLCALTPARPPARRGRAAAAKAGDPQSGTRTATKAKAGAKPRSRAKAKPEPGPAAPKPTEPAPA